MITNQEDFEKQVHQIFKNVEVIPDTVLRLEELARDAVAIAGAVAPGWQHTVCHLFEHYYSLAEEPSCIPSFLDRTAFLPAAEMLANKSAEIAQKGDCFTRIAGPIARYNLDVMLRDGLTDKFPFKPASFYDEKFDDWSDLDMWDPAGSEQIWVLFLQSKTPQDFIAALIKNPNLERDPVLFNIVQKEMGQQAAIKLIESRVGFYNQKKEEFLHNGTKSPTQKWGYVDAANQIREWNPEGYAEELLALAAIQEIATQSKLQSDITPGVFVDVEGTLLGNPLLAGYLNYLLKKGVAVTVFSGGDAEELTDKLAREGVNSHLLPVVPKNEYRGRCLEVLIDDTNTEYQGFVATLHIEPFTSYEDRNFRNYLEEKWGKPGAAVTPIHNRLTDLMDKPSHHGGGLWNKIKERLGL